MTKHNNILDRSELFMPGNVPITIMDAEHNGNGGMHSHTFYEIVYINSGFSLHTCNGIVKVLATGDMFAMRPGDNHSYNSAHKIKLYNCLFYKEAIKWMEDELTELMGVSRLFKNGSMPWKKVNLSLPERSEAVMLLEKMKWESLTKSVGWRVNMKTLLASYIVFYARVYGREYNYKPELDNSYSKYIYKLLEYIENNYTKDIDTDDLAGVVGLSPDYLTKQFKKGLGFSPAEYVRNYRISMAMEQLKNTGESINDISNRLGFASLSLFSRQFRSIIGMTPTEYRKGQE